ncbi:hypothetical protein IW262DRAFT_1486000 [Armillaria fumosa]|nr:hypothetical protein IW262DRAFT_1486000 [Armillaria fumosa]
MACPPLVRDTGRLSTIRFRSAQMTRGSPDSEVHKFSQEIRAAGYLRVKQASHKSGQSMAKKFGAARLCEAVLIRPGIYIYSLYFVCPFKNSNRTPNSSDPPLSQSLYEDAPRIKEALKAHGEAKDKKFRCVVAGIDDQTTVSEVSAFPDEVQKAPHTESTYFHVFDQDPGDTKLDYAASVLDVLEYGFGYDVEQLQAKCILLTMERNACESFNRSEVWFEKTKLANCYKIMRTAIPSETLLILRAVCAKIAHLPNF